MVFSSINSLIEPIKINFLGLNFFANTIDNLYKVTIVKANCYSARFIRETKNVNKVFVEKARIIEYFGFNGGF